MLHGRFNIFSCDGCGEQVATKTFPEGYVFISSGKRGVIHFCAKCATPEHGDKMAAEVGARTAPMVHRSPNFIVTTPIKDEDND